jgi:adenylate cyclase
MGLVTTNAELKLAVLEALHRAFDNGLDRSERQRKLLSYLVTEELEGRGDRIKAYSIATEVFDRPKDFDPQLDSIVRVEVGRLRQALERYYLTDGKTAPLVISIPKGQYRPVFTPAAANEEAPRRGLKKGLLLAGAIFACALGALTAWKFAVPATQEVQHAAGPRSPVVAIAPFEFHSDKDGQDFVAGGLQADLADTLSDYQWLTVIPLNEETGAASSQDGAKPDFIVRASLRLIGDQVKATVLLLDARSGAVRWTNRYEMRLTAGDVLAMQRDLVAKIGRDVGSPFRIVADIARAQEDTIQAANDEALSCQLRAFHYWKTFKSRDYPPAWQCFVAAEARSPLDAETLAIGALLSLDPLNFRLSGRSHAEARSQAIRMAARAAEISEANFLTRVASYSAALCIGDIESFRAQARETVERFPNNPIALADVGARFILSSGDYEEGVALIEKARAIAADLTPVDTIALAIDALRRGVYEERPRLRQAATRTDSALVLAVELALAAARGDRERSAHIRGRLAEIGFSDQKAIGDVLDSTCWSQNTRDLLNSKMTLAFVDAPAR